jgi:hypothetical protein
MTSYRAFGGSGFKAKILTGKFALVVSVVMEL